MCGGLIWFTLRRSSDELSRDTRPKWHPDPLPRLLMSTPSARYVPIQCGATRHDAKMAETLFVVVAGPPASGKSTLAHVLATRLRLPLVAKDTIKDAIMSVLPVPDVEVSRQLGRASVAAMLAVAVESPVGAVIESNFYRSTADELLRGLPGFVVEVFCRCDRAVSIQRYRERAGTRAAGHFDEVRTDDEIWSVEVSEPVTAGWPVIEIDTTSSVDADRASPPSGAWSRVTHRCRFRS